MKSELSVTEGKQLAKLEASISTGLRSAKGALLSCWRDLAVIRDGRLYRATDATFADYCERRWQITRRRVDQLIAAGMISHEKSISQILCERLTGAETTTLEENGGGQKSTSKAKERTSKAAAKGSSDEETDATGYPIPVGISIDWHRAQGFDAVLKDLHRLKLLVEHGIEQGDVIYAEVTNATIAAIENVHYTLQGVLPHAVCPTCSGHRPERCKLCKGRGFISEFLWDRAVPVETKRARSDGGKRK